MNLEESNDQLNVTCPSGMNDLEEGLKSASFKANTDRPMSSHKDLDVPKVTLFDDSDYHGDDYGEVPEVVAKKQPGPASKTGKDPTAGVLFPEPTVNVPSKDASETSPSRHPSKDKRKTQPAQAKSALLDDQMPNEGAAHDPKETRTKLLKPETKKLLGGEEAYAAVFMKKGTTKEVSKVGLASKVLSNKLPAKIVKTKPVATIKLGSKEKSDDSQSEDSHSEDVQPVGLKGKKVKAAPASKKPATTKKVASQTAPKEVDDAEFGDISTEDMEPTRPKGKKEKSGPVAKKTKAGATKHQPIDSEVKPKPEVPKRQTKSSKPVLKKQSSEDVEKDSTDVRTSKPLPKPAKATTTTKTATKSGKSKMTEKENSEDVDAEDAPDAKNLKSFKKPGKTTTSKTATETGKSKKTGIEENQKKGAVKTGAKGRKVASKAASKEESDDAKSEDSTAEDVEPTIAKGKEDKAGLATKNPKASATRVKTKGVGSDKENHELLVPKRPQQKTGKKTTKPDPEEASEPDDESQDSTEQNEETPEPRKRRVRIKVMSKVKASLKKKRLSSARLSLTIGRASTKHPSTRVMILAAMKELQIGRSAVSIPAIKSYLEDNYQVRNYSIYIRKALLKAVEDGLLVQKTGRGASGSFLLAPQKLVKKNGAKASEGVPVDSKKMVASSPAKGAPNKK